MPSKSRRKRGKYTPQTKKKKRPSLPDTVAQQPVVAQAQQPVASRDRPAPKTAAATPVAKSPIIQHPYNIATELRTIGILAGIMLIALTVLALVLA